MDNRIDAIYGRQSIDKKDSISIESQFEFCRYELKGGEGREYKDKGYSGKNIERPDFQRLLQDIKLGLIKRVIVYKLDRISRSIVDFAKLMELFKQYNVEFVSCTEKFDTSTPMGRAMLNICIVFAQLERESIQMRVQDAFYSRCTKGYYMRGRTPYGFDTEPIVMDGIKTKKLVENAEMDFAELMFQMYAEPGNSYGDITRYFVKHSIKVYDKALQPVYRIVYFIFIGYQRINNTFVLIQANETVISRRKVFTVLYSFIPKHYMRKITSVVIIKVNRRSRTGFIDYWSKKQKCFTKQ